MGYFNRISQYNLDARKHPVYKSWWKPPEATARSTARRAASRAYTTRGTAKMGGVVIDATRTLSLMDKLRVVNLGKAGLKRIIRVEIVKARKGVQEEATKAMKHDPRKAAKGVQMLVYKGGGDVNFGGNINILKPKKNEATRSIAWALVRKRGKIRRRRKRSDTTNMIDGYFGKNRYFVLHWIDAGANRKKRGQIAATNFFTRTSKQAMQIAAENIKSKIAGLIKQQ